MDTIMSNTAMQVRSISCTFAVKKIEEKVNHVLSPSRIESLSIFELGYIHFRQCFSSIRGCFVNFIHTFKVKFYLLNT